MSAGRPIESFESLRDQGDGQNSAQIHVNLLESMRNSDISRQFIIFFEVSAKFREHFIKIDANFIEKCEKIVIVCRNFKDHEIVTDFLLKF